MMKSKIRKISEKDNILFELTQYKVELDFHLESQNRPLYEKYADHIVSEDGYSIEDTVSAVREIFDIQPV